MPTPEDYVAGALVANAVAWIITGLVEVPLLVGVLLYALGSVLAGFLVARKAKDEIFWKVGLKSGFGAFVLHMFVNTAVEIVKSVVTWTLMAHLIVLTTLLLGSVFGALLFSLARRGGVAKRG